MFIHILGSAAGGGFPQWNCNCRNCQGVRNGSMRTQARSQSSIALSDDGEHWILCNASPDIRQQIESFSALNPARTLRDSAICGIILLDSQIDHTTGLLTLREGCPHQVWCTEMVHQDLTSGFPVFNMLSHWNGGLEHRRIELDAQAFRIDACPALEITAIPLRSSAPPYSPHRGNPHPGDNIGLFVRDSRTGSSLFYAPGLGQVDGALLEWMQQADCLLVDGTLWRDDEMQHCQVGDKLGSEMGHLCQSGPGGMIEVLDSLAAPQKILIHINNTNPILDLDSPEHAELRAHGIQVAWDGMHIQL